MNYQAAKNNGWIKWGAMAACLCLVIVGIMIYAGKSLRSSATQYGVTAEVVEVLEDGQYKVKVTGEDENFDIGDIVIINYAYTSDETERMPLKTGDVIAITYPTFEKTDTLFEITSGQIEIVLEQ